MASDQKKSKLIRWSEVYDMRIYPKQAVSKAIEDYSSLGKFAMKESNGRIMVKAFIPAESDFHFREEFSNYVLGMVIKCR